MPIAPRAHPLRMQSHAELDPFVALARIVEHAVSLVPGAQCGSLLVRGTGGLVHEVTVGYGHARLVGHVVPRAAWVEQSEPRLVEAATWRAEHLPAAVAQADPPLRSAVVHVVPVRLGSRQLGEIAVEQSPASALTAAQTERLSLAGEVAAMVLERRWLWRDKALLTQELRLLDDVLDAVAAATSMEGLVEAIGQGCKDILPHKRWTEASLMLLREDGRSVDVYDLGHAPIDAYWRNVRSGARSAGRDFGVEVDVRLVQATAQAAVIDEAIRGGVDGIAVAPIHPLEVEPAIRRARRAGIPVVAFDTPPAEDSEALLYIGTDNLAAGRLAGELMTRLLPLGGSVQVLVGSLLARNARLRLEGFQAAIAGSGIKTLPVLEDGRDVGSGEKLARGALEERLHLDGALGLFADNGLTWATVAEATGRAGGLKIIGFDLSADTIAVLMRGLLHATVVQHEQEMAYKSIEVLHRMATVGIAPVLSDLPASRFIDTGTEAITLQPTSWSTALADYLARLSTERRRGIAKPAVQRAKPLRLLVVGLASAQGDRTAARQASFHRASAIGEAIESGKSLVVSTLEDPHASYEDVRTLAGHGARAVVAVPLRTGGAPLGALLLASASPSPSDAADLLVLDRVAGAAAAAIQSRQLLLELTARNDELVRAADEQAVLVRAMADMSTPVVPIASGVLVLPLVGALDRNRCARFIEVMLHEIVDHKARIVLIDLTGAQGVQSAEIAGHLVQAAGAARMLGARVVLVGISPEAAQAMVEQGLDLGGLVTRADLQSGLAYALRELGGRLVAPR